MSFCQDVWFIGSLISKKKYTLYFTPVIELLNNAHTDLQFIILFSVKIHLLLASWVSSWAWDPLWSSPIENVLIDNIIFFPKQRKCDILDVFSLCQRKRFYRQKPPYFAKPGTFQKSCNYVSTMRRWWKQVGHGLQLNGLLLQCWVLFHWRRKWAKHSPENIAQPLPWNGRGKCLCHFMTTNKIN